MAQTPAGTDREDAVEEDATAAETHPDQEPRPTAVVENAVGIVMSPGGRSPQEAFEILERVSQRQDRDVDDVAKELVELTEQRTPPVAPTDAH